MKWFKHQSNARNDERIAQLEDLSGLEGYGFYFKVLEIIAENVDESDKDFAEYSVSAWSKKLNILPNKFKKLVENCVKTELFLVEKRVKTDKKLSKNSLESYKIISPNILKFRDNHTKNLQVTCQQEKEIEKEIEKETDTDKKRLQESFDNFYKCYPRKTNKPKALSAWIKLKPNDDLVEKIIDAVEKSKLTHGWTKDGGEFIPYPASWLNAKRWEDEIDIVPIRVVEVVKEKRYFN